MSLLHIPFDDLRGSDLEGLVANAVREGRYLDYKEQQIGRRQQDTKEFLKDVVSFANADGGDLILGVREQRDADNKPTAIPEKLVGLAGVNLDEEMNRLENVIRTGVARRLLGVRMRPVGDPPCLVIRVPRSWDGPHMITTGESRFYSRHSAGKFPLDVEQIRQAMLGGETRREQLRLFRADRTGRVIAQETPVPVGPDPKLILHAMPLRDGDLFAQIMGLRDHDRLTHLRPAGSGGWNPHHNLDGFVAWSTPVDGFAPYVQVFRTGILEAVGKVWSTLEGESPRFSGTDVERDCIQTVADWLQLWRLAGESGPMILALTITGVRGQRIATDRPGFGGHFVAPIDRDVMVIPDVVEDDLTKAADVILKPIFDMLWQAGGRAGSPYYKDGRSVLVR